MRENERILFFGVNPLTEKLEGSGNEIGTGSTVSER
jgi:hypothetical protein